MIPSASRAFTLSAVLWQFLPLSQAAYQPCPLLRAYYPPPTISKSSDAVKALSKGFTEVFDNLIRTGKSDDFGEITPNTTSFSVVLFSAAEADDADPIFYSYHYTAPATAQTVAKNISLDTVLPLGSLTQLFTVYSWLAEMGIETWNDPITKYLPELSKAAGSRDKFAVDWSAITVEALAGHMAGVARDSNICQLGAACDKQAFINSFANVSPVFLPDTTPLLSNAAFQLLAFAITSRTKTTKGPAPSFSDVLKKSVLEPLKMTHSALLDKHNAASIFGGADSLDCSAKGEQAALSLISTPRDLALSGHAILSSRLLPAATTRRWLSPVSADTSNGRNGVGKPWEVYRAPLLLPKPSSQLIVDVLLKSGDVGPYSSYLGLVPDVGVGFAILAHDANDEDKPADLNVHADIVAAVGLGNLLGLAAKQAGSQFPGTFVSGDGGKDVAVIEVPEDGYPGFVVSRLVVNGKDVRAAAAQAAGIEKVEDLDFRVYATNVVADLKGKGGKGKKQQFVAVLQDKSALVDAGTPTCISWMMADGPGAAVPSRFVFELDGKGVAVKVSIPHMGVSFGRKAT
ncbi:beta-lactamase/transpeptidase-like protein [Apodospora peruviana]|uniref:Beta-lactamase/transpeptidase-like protein n=1 Tax=Apodospora peruviana TaxID=516989 RepID=A0AAE0HSZ6_9PEZI|nr:beta-lactamase/transpeptidase-like protein [Apodospora peruviana]